MLTRRIRAPASLRCVRAGACATRHAARACSACGCAPAAAAGACIAAVRDGGLLLADLLHRTERLRRHLRRRLARHRSAAGRRHAELTRLADLRSLPAGATRDRRADRWAARAQEDRAGVVGAALAAQARPRAFGLATGSRFIVPPLRAALHHVRFGLVLEVVERRACGGRRRPAPSRSTSRRARGRRRRVRSPSSTLEPGRTWATMPCRSSEISDMSRT